VFLLVALVFGQSRFLMVVSHTALSSVFGKYTVFQGNVCAAAVSIPQNEMVSAKMNVYNRTTFIILVVKDGFVVKMLFCHKKVHFSCISL
jgi:hypothetical protein